MKSKHVAFLWVVVCFWSNRGFCANSETVESLVDITESAGISFTHHSGAFGKKYLPETMGAGCAFFDFNNDGLQDIFLVNGKDWPAQKSKKRHTPALYKNQGHGTFKDVTISAGLALEMYGMGCIAADYDNDGDNDLYLLNLEKNLLFQNKGDGTYTNVTDIAGVGGDAWSTSGS
jgi:hypothetical protein